VVGMREMRDWAAKMSHRIRYKGSVCGGKR
jgi:hypothetical protein